MGIDLSIIIPTFREYNNITVVVSTIASVLGDLDIQYEIIIVDDYSEDGTDSLCANLAEKYPLRLIQRRDEKRDLSLAVMEGIKASSGKYLVVMDADMSHHPNRIPIMFDSLANNKLDFVIGSRYVDGGSICDAWPFYRRLNSKVATLLTKIFFFIALNMDQLRHIRDPMSGFFSFNRSKLGKVEDLSPIGFKIGLEILVKGDFSKVGEVPIQFGERLSGSSKLNFKQQLSYLNHLLKLFRYTNPGILSPLSVIVIGIFIAAFFLIL